MHIKADLIFFTVEFFYSLYYKHCSLLFQAKTTKHGITQTNQLVDLTDLCRQHIIPELQKPNVDDLPVLKASAVKYILTFR